MFHYHDVLLYPSEGEGFGLIPLQALATGMPVISTGVWCSYEKFLLGNVIDSTMGVSPVKERYERFGDVVLPNLKSFVDLLKTTADEITKQSKAFLSQVPEITAEYNWQYRTNMAMDSLIERLGVEMFDTTIDYLPKEL
jgi:glycosyltransferase involved in cell wall biosynthesis